MNVTVIEDLSDDEVRQHMPAFGRYLRDNGVYQADLRSVAHNYWYTVFGDDETADAHVDSIWNIIDDYFSRWVVLSWYTDSMGGDTSDSIGGLRLGEVALVAQPPTDGQWTWLVGPAVEDDVHSYAWNFVADTLLAGNLLPSTIESSVLTNTDLRQIVRSILDSRANEPQGGWVDLAEKYGLHADDHETILDAYIGPSG